MTTVWHRTTKYIVAVGLIGLGLWIEYLSRSTIPLLVLAGLLALLVSPVIGFLHTRLRMPLWLAVAVAYALLMVGLAVLLWSVVTSLGQTVQAIDSASGSLGLNGLAVVSLRLRATALPLPGLNVTLSDSIDHVLAALRGTPGSGPIAATPSELTASLGPALLRTFVIGVSGLGAGLSILTSLTLILLLAVYLSVSHKWLSRAFMHKVPPAYRSEIAGVSSKIKSIWAGYLLGQILLQLIVGVAVWLGLTVLGLPGAVGLGFVAAILYIIPNIGMLLAAVPAALLAVTLGSSHLAVSHGGFALVVVAFYVLLAIVVNTLVVPIVMSTSLDLHPLIFTIGILVGAATAGVLGAVLAAPVIASGQVVVGYLYAKILEQPGSEDEEPAPRVDVLQIPSGFEEEGRDEHAGQPSNRSEDMKQGTGDCYGR